MNILAITIGTRDVQINISKIDFRIFDFDGKSITPKDNPELKITGYTPDGFKDTFCIIAPRINGKTIADNFDVYKPVLHFPLIEPVVNYLLNKPETAIDAVFTLYTDQSEEYKKGLVKQKDFDNDTLYFSSIIAEYLTEKLGHNNVDEYPVHEQVTNIDYLYTHFEQQGRHLFEIDPDKIEKIYLLPQGGIDQINQAFTLKLIQKFGGKVIQLQQAESRETQQLKFPRLFLADLKRQETIRHLSDYDFNATYHNLRNNNDKSNLQLIKHLACYADKRLHLRYDELKVNIGYILPRVSDLNLKGKLEDLADNNIEKLKDLFICLKINYQQKRVNDFVWRLFTLSENFFKVYVEDILNINADDYFIRGRQVNKNLKWENILGNNLVHYLQQKNVRLDNPNRYAFREIFFYCCKNDQYKWNNSQISLQQLEIASGNLETISTERNKIAHELSPTNAQSLSRQFDKGYNLDLLLSDYSNALNIKGFGVFDIIKNYCLELI